MKAPTKPHRSSFFFRTCLVLTVIQLHSSHAYGQPQQGNTTAEKTEGDEALSVELYSNGTEATDKGKEDEAVTKLLFENEGLSHLNDAEIEQEETIVEERWDMTPAMTEADLGVQFSTEAMKHVRAGKKNKSPYQVHSTTTKEVLDRMHSQDLMLSDGMQNQNARHDDFDTRRRKLYLSPSEAATIGDAISAADNGNTELCLDILASTIVVGVCYVASFMAAAATAGVSVALMPLLCAAMGFWASVIFSTFDFLDIGNWFGEPANDDVWWTVEAADLINAEGNALGVTYHRSGGSDDDSLGHIDRGEIKTSREDLDSQPLVAIEVRVEDTNDVCVKNMAFKIGKEPSGTGHVENISISAPIISYITNTKLHNNVNMCILFGDEEGAIGNFKFHWPSASICQRNFGEYFSLDYANCLRYAMYRYDVMNSNRYSRTVFRSGNVPSLPSSYQNPMGMVVSKKGRSNGADLCFDLQNYNTNNLNPVTLIVCKDNSAQNFDFDRDGRIRSQVDPTKCVEAGSRGTLYTKLFIWDCHHGDWQRWIRYSSGRIRNVYHRRFIGLAYCNAKHGEKLELRPYETGSCGDAQKWIS